MINPNAKLAENLGDKSKLKMKATRDGYGRAVGYLFYNHQLPWV